MTDARAGQDRADAGPAGQGPARPGQSGYPSAVERYRVLIGPRALTVDVIERDTGLFVSVDEGPELPVDVLMRRDDGEIGVVVAGRLLRGLVGAQSGGRAAAGRTVVHDGESVDVTVLDERAARLVSAAQHARPHVSETAVRAPMPGLVVAVPVEVGQAVKEGTTLVVLSAMKMQNELTAHEDATVKEVLVSPGQTVDQNQVLVRLE